MCVCVCVCMCMYHRNTEANVKKCMCVSITETWLIDLRTYSEEQTSPRNKKRHVHIGLPATTALVEATAGIIFFTTPVNESVQDYWSRDIHLRRLFFKNKVLIQCPNDKAFSHCQGCRCLEVSNAQTLCKPMCDACDWKLCSPLGRLPTAMKGLLGYASV